jgi:hypothetical protein
MRHMLGPSSTVIPDHQVVDVDAAFSRLFFSSAFASAERTSFASGRAARLWRQIEDGKRILDALAADLSATSRALRALPEVPLSLCPSPSH